VFDLLSIQWGGKAAFRAPHYLRESQREIPLSQMSINYKFIPLVALVIAVIALVINTKNYRRKAGIFIRGSVGFGSSIYGNDKYVHELILENLKDRAVTIFAIYVRVGYSYYIELEDFETNPLTLKPFETYRKQFGPVEFYNVNMRRININKLLDSDRVRKAIFLSTSDGRYKVPARIRRWNPIVNSFKNHMTAVVRPVRSTFKDHDLGGNTRFVIEFFAANGREEIALIHPHDYRIVKFKKFRLTPESLESKNALEQLLDQQMANGNLTCERFVVHDIDAWRAGAHEHYTTEPIMAEHYGAFRYFILGKLGTVLANRKMKRENEAIRRRVQHPVAAMNTSPANEPKDTA